MLKEDKNLKDSNSSSRIVIKDNPTTISYGKSNKLIAALYMVTDIIDNGEPLKNKLRTLGTEIISDIHSIPIQATSKIVQVISFLDLASTIKLISEMNHNILKIEFLKLEQSIKEHGKVKSTWLEDFLVNSPDTNLDTTDSERSVLKDNQRQYLGHQSSLRTIQEKTRIGVQKGGTLMKALSDKIGHKAKFNTLDLNLRSPHFDMLKKQRREEIVRIVETSENGLTITDIKNIAQGHSSQVRAIISCSEKTLQRELVSMVKDGVLDKKGEKRWSRYYISKSLHSV